MGCTLAKADFLSRPVPNRVPLEHLYVLPAGRGQTIVRAYYGGNTCPDGQALRSRQGQASVLGASFNGMFSVLPRRRRILTRRCWPRSPVRLVFAKASARRLPGRFRIACKVNLNFRVFGKFHVAAMTCDQENGRGPESHISRCGCDGGIAHSCGNRADGRFGKIVGNFSEGIAQPNVHQSLAYSRLAAPHCSLFIHHESRRSIRISSFERTRHAQPVSVGGLDSVHFHRQPSPPAPPTPWDLARHIALHKRPPRVENISQPKKIPPASPKQLPLR